MSITMNQSRGVRGIEYHMRRSMPGENVGVDGTGIPAHLEVEVRSS